MDATSEGVSVSQWARSRGLAVSTAHKGVRSGRITRLPNGRLDPERADAEWRQNTRTRVDSPTLQVGGSPDAPPRAPRRLARPAPGDPLWTHERARATRATADLRELELSKARGELIRVDDAARIWEDALGRMRARMMSSIGSYAPRVVEVVRLEDARQLVEDLVYGALREVVGVGEEIENEAIGP